MKYNGRMPGSNAVDNRWYKEDRDQYKGEELKKQKEESEKALRNSTLIIRRLSRILEEEIQKTYLEEEEYTHQAWERVVLASAAKRKAYKQVLNLLPSKKD